MAKTILILFVLAGALIAPEDLSSCGPFETEHLFASKRGPLDQARYFGGRLDIVEPHYARIYLVAAYRYLSGMGLSAADQKALLTRPAGPDYWNPQGGGAAQDWLRMRVTVGAPAMDRVSQFRIYDQNELTLNCGDDAFRNAAAVLGEHFRAGRNHDDLRAWVAAQDQVFANCSGAGGVPAPLGAGAASWMRADRAYQIAAAKFYGGGFDGAASDFLLIAADRTSPWHGIAPYLAARALIRKTTLVDANAAAAAQDQLRKVLADPDAAQWHASARGLMRYLRMRTDPPGAFNEMAHALETEKTGVAGIMNDYRLLFDRLDNHQQNPPRDADITDWIATMQHDADDHALAKWRATRSLPWLVAALTWADKPDAEMMAAAARVGESSPAYLTVELHRLRLLPADEARPRLDAMLSRKMPVAARNLFLAERMRVARDWDELLRFAPRTEAGTFDGVREEATTGRPARYFDEDAASILDRQAPLAVLRQAAQSPWLPANLQLEAARAVWVRSIMLGDVAMAKDIAPVLASLAPYLQPQLEGYLAAPVEKSRTFAAAWLLLNNPGMRPWIDAGPGRGTPTPRIDSFRDNWWCLANRWNLPVNAPLDLVYQGAAPEAGFLSKAERDLARQERQRMDAFPAAATFMAQQAVEWAGTHPGDPRVPEALHLAVRGVRYVCGGDGDTDRWAKRAFRLLHVSYAKTEAARQTPYWYQAGAR